MHHKSLSFPVSSISSKQGFYRGRVPHWCLSATRSRLEPWSQMTKKKKKEEERVNPTTGFLNNLDLTGTLGLFSFPPLFLSVPFASGHLTSLHTFLPVAVGSCS